VQHTPRPFAMAGVNGFDPFKD